MMVSHHPRSPHALAAAFWHTTELNQEEDDEGDARRYLDDDFNEGKKGREGKEGKESEASEAKEDRCHRCGSCLFQDDAFPVCVACGVLDRHVLDYSPEWRSFGNDEGNKGAGGDSTRCGNPGNPLFQDSSFGCQVMLSSNSSLQMKRIRKWISWQSASHREKSLYDVFQHINAMAQAAGIPRLFIDEAIVIYKDISERKLFRGMNRDGIKAASIYLSCRLNGCPRTSQEIADIFRLDKTSATNGCSMAVHILNNTQGQGIHHIKLQHDLCNTTPTMFLERYCSRLRLSAELTMLCKFIAHKLEKEEAITDNTPHAVAAGIVYFVAVHCHVPLTKQDLKHVCSVSEVTINKCYKKLEAMRDQLLPRAVLAKYQQPDPAKDR